MQGLRIPCLLFFSVQFGAIFWYLSRGIDTVWNYTMGVGKCRVINPQVTIKNREDEDPTTALPEPISFKCTFCISNPVRNIEPKARVISAVAGSPV